MINNKIEKTFGSAGSFAGYILILFGIMIMISWAGILLVLIGLFFAFSYSGISIDTDKSRFKQFTKLFGIIKVGDWEDIYGFEKLLIKNNDNVFRVFSRGNRSIESRSDTYLICMVHSNEVTIIPVMKCSSYDKVMAKASELSNILNLPVENNVEHRVIELNENDEI